MFKILLLPLYKEYTSTGKRGKEGIVARSNFNGPQEESSQPGRGKCTSTRARKMEQTRHVTVIKWRDLENGNKLHKGKEQEENRKT